MREIKFRVWDRRIEKMGEVTEIRFSRVQHNLVKYRYTDDRGKVIDEQSHFDKGFSNGLDIMQYTGIKDINGKEIYEGDICKLTSKEGYSNDCFSVDEDLEMTCVVRYNDYMYLFQDIKYEYKEILLCEIDENSIAVEVLGNVFENPELVNERKNK